MAKKVAKKPAAKVAAKPAAAKAASSAKPAAAPKPAKISPADKPRTKSEVYRVIAEHTGVAKKEVEAVFDTMGQLITADLKGKGGPGVFNIGGMMKVILHTKPATKAREGINPKTGERITIAAKPARKVVKVRPLKTLKDMVL